MQIAFFSSKTYDREYFERANQGEDHELLFFEERLGEHNLALAPRGGVVCAFVNDVLNRNVLEGLAQREVRLIALRCAGYNQVDLPAAKELGLTVVRVPAYSPYAVAEHSVALLLCLNRKLHKAYARVREGNYSLKGLCGVDLHGRTVGIIGTGTIGAVFARIMGGFGCSLVACDPNPSAEMKRQGVEYLAFEQLLERSDIVSLHCPLKSATRHLIDAPAIDRMKPGAILINTGRGALVDTAALIDGLKSRRLGGVALDVYEEEASVFFEDHSADIIDDDLLMRLVTFPNVLLTSHQGFMTEEALTQISEVTLANVRAFLAGSGEMHTVGD